MYACSCRQVTVQQVREAGRLGILTPAALTVYFGLDDSEACGRCLEDVDLFADLALGAVETEPEASLA